MYEELDDVRRAIQAIIGRPLERFHHVNVAEDKRSGHGEFKDEEGNHDFIFLRAANGSLYVKITDWHVARFEGEQAIAELHALAKDCLPDVRPV